MYLFVYLYAYLSFEASFIDFNRSDYVFFFLSVEFRSLVDG